MKVYIIKRHLVNGSQVVLAFAKTEPEAINIISAKFGKSDDWYVVSSEAPTEAKWFFNAMVK